MTRNEMSFLKGYIIEAYNNMGNAYVSTRLIEEAGKRNIELRMIGAQDIALCDGIVWNKGVKVEPVDFILNRYKWGKIKNVLNLLGERSYNNLEAFERYVNKYEQMKRLDSRHFRKPKYILGNSCLSYGSLSGYLGRRIVAKGLENSMGREIFLLESQKDMKQLKEYGEQKEWLFEEFIETSYGKDLRVYAVRGEVIGCMKRQTDSDFRANVALGAATFPYEVTDTLREIAKDIYHQTSLDFMGIDLLFGESGFYLCEINVMPGFRGIEETLGVNVAGRIMDMICEDFNHGQN